MDNCQSKNQDENFPLILNKDYYLYEESKPKHPILQFFELINQEANAQRLNIKRQTKKDKNADKNNNISTNNINNNNVNSNNKNNIMKTNASNLDTIKSSKNINKQIIKEKTKIQKKNTLGMDEKLNHKHHRNYLSDKILIKEKKERDKGGGGEGGGGQSQENENDKKKEKENDEEEEEENDKEKVNSKGKKNSFRKKNRHSGRTKKKLFSISVFSSGQSSNSNKEESDKENDNNKKSIINRKGTKTESVNFFRFENSTLPEIHKKKASNKKLEIETRNSTKYMSNFDLKRAYLSRKNIKKIKDINISKSNKLLIPVNNESHEYQGDPELVNNNLFFISKPSLFSPNNQRNQFNRSKYEKYNSIPQKGINFSILNGNLVFNNYNSLSKSFIGANKNNNKMSPISIINRKNTKIATTSNPSPLNSSPLDHSGFSRFYKGVSREDKKNITSIRKEGGGNRINIFNPNDNYKNKFNTLGLKRNERCLGEAISFCTANNGLSFTLGNLYNNNNNLNNGNNGNNCNNGNDGEISETIEMNINNTNNEDKYKPKVIKKIINPNFGYKNTTLNTYSNYIINTTNNIINNNNSNSLIETKSKKQKNVLKKYEKKRTQSADLSRNEINSSSKNIFNGIQGQYEPEIFFDSESESKNNNKENEVENKEKKVNHSNILLLNENTAEKIESDIKHTTIENDYSNNEKIINNNNNSIFSGLDEGGENSTTNNNTTNLANNTKSNLQNYFRLNSNYPIKENSENSFQNNTNNNNISNMDSSYLCNNTIKSNKNDSKNSFFVRSKARQKTLSFPSKFSIRSLRPIHPSIKIFKKSNSIVKRKKEKKIKEEKNKSILTQKSFISNCHKKLNKRFKSLRSMKSIKNDVMIIIIKDSILYMKEKTIQGLPQPFYKFNMFSCIDKNYSNNNKDEKDEKKDGKEEEKEEEKEEKEEKDEKKEEKKEEKEEEERGTKLRAQLEEWKFINPNKKRIVNFLRYLIKSKFMSVFYQSNVNFLYVNDKYFNLYPMILSSIQVDWLDPMEKDKYINLINVIFDENKLSLNNEQNNMIFSEKNKINKRLITETLMLVNRIDSITKVPRICKKTMRRCSDLGDKVKKRVRLNSKDNNVEQRKGTPENRSPNGTQMKRALFSCAKTMQKHRLTKILSRTNTAGNADQNFVSSFLLKHKGTIDRIKKKNFISTSIDSNNNNKDNNNIEGEVNPFDENIESKKNFGKKNTLNTNINNGLKKKLLEVDDKRNEFDNIRTKIDNFNILTNKHIFKQDNQLFGLDSFQKKFGELLKVSKNRLILKKKLKNDTMIIKCAGYDMLTKEASLIKTQEIEKDLPQVKKFQKFVYAIQNRKMKLFDRLLQDENASEAINRQDGSTGNTLLIYATQNNIKSICEKLLKKGCNPNIQNKFGNTALHIAYKGNNSFIVNLLLQFYANDKIRNNDGLFPWQMYES